MSQGQNPKSDKVLYKHERQSFVSVVEMLASVGNTQQLLSCVVGPLQELFPHESFLCGLGHIAFDHIDLSKTIVHNFPHDYIDEICDPATKEIVSPLLDALLRTRKPQLFNIEQDADKYGRDYLVWLECFKRFDLRNVAAHGVTDVQGAVSSYFGFYRIPDAVGEHHAYLLELLVPHLHGALIRCLTMEKYNANYAPIPLSKEQRHILYWIYRMKTNWEIAKIIDISENTVKYHIKEILSKMEASCRAEAVAKALHSNYHAI